MATVYEHAHWDFECLVCRVKVPLDDPIPLAEHILSKGHWEKATEIIRRKEDQSSIACAVHLGCNIQCPNGSKMMIHLNFYTGLARTETVEQRKARWYTNSCYSREERNQRTAAIMYKEAKEAKPLEQLSTKENEYISLFRNAMARVAAANQKLRENSRLQEKDTWVEVTGIGNSLSASELKKE